MRPSVRLISTEFHCAKRTSKLFNYFVTASTSAEMLVQSSRICSMQNAKDSFYMALRTRLALINPERTLLLRGTVRPGILVEEAEAPFSQLPSDAFVLRWLGLGADHELASTMSAEECE